MHMCDIHGGGRMTPIDMTMRRVGHAVCRSPMQENNFTSFWQAPQPWTFWFHGTAKMEKQ
jgi:hypothetical protein